MVLSFKAEFQSDGDYGFYEERLSKLFYIDSPLYKEAVLDYHYEHEDEFTFVSLRVEGKKEACKYACGDLLEALICSFHPCKYWLVKDMYEIFEYFYEDLWKDNNVCKEKSLGGNYDGTDLFLTMEE